MKRLILLLLGFSYYCSFGQAETEDLKKVSAAFEQHFNADEFLAIFNMFAPGMQSALPEGEAIDFLQGLKQQAGKIRQREFTGYERGTFAVYKTTFERAVLSLNLSVDAESRINGMLVKPFEEKNTPQLSRNKTALQLPFKGEWTIVWGGDTEELNYHVVSEAQKGAFDIVITDESGSSYSGEGTRNGDYYAFGKELLAPCDAEVVLAVDGIKDNTPGDLNPIYVPGNTVILKTAHDEHLFFAHFKQHSLQVKEGQKVKTGDVLGLCGNSGNSSEPHLHFHIQNVEDMNMATGVKCYFDQILVNGELKKDYSPIQGEKVENTID